MRNLFPSGQTGKFGVDASVLTGLTSFHRLSVDWDCTRFEETSKPTDPRNDAPAERLQILCLRGILSKWIFHLMGHAETDHILVLQPSITGVQVGS